MAIDVQTPRYVRQDFQLEDLAKLRGMLYAANWSEVGCMKTSTALWDAEDTLEADPPQGVAHVS